MHQSANLWTVCWIAEMVFLYPKFIHDVSKNVAPLSRLLKGMIFFPFGRTNTSYQSLPCRRPFGKYQFCRWLATCREKLLSLPA